MNILFPLQRIGRSLKLDIDWICTPKIPEKWKFLWTKYLFIAFPLLFWNKKLRAFGIPGWNRTTYINKPGRIAHLQSIFIDHAHLKNIFPPSGIVVDVGGHIGEFALFAYAHLHPSHIYSFEPVPRSFELLEKNNRDSHFNIGICSDARLKLNIDHQSGMSSKFETPNTVGTTVVGCVSLDDVPAIKAVPVIDLLKIDVEGMEYEVLASSPKTIRKSRYLVIEVALHRPSSASGLDTISLLHQLSPHIELAHIGHIIRYADTGKEAAADMLFQNTSI